jgi:hypothetical protein
MYLASFPNRSRPSASVGDGLPGWKKVEWRRQSARGLPLPATRETAEDDEDDDDDWG